MAQGTGEAQRRRSRRSQAARGRPLRPDLAARAPQAGYVVGGKYRIEGLLGQGGMGAVYRAVHLVSDKRVAVKWMLPVHEAPEELSERFVREARATARIDHPNVVDVYDVGSQDGSVYLVMELLHGESLAERLERGPLPQTEAVALLMPALRAVAAAHAQGVIHRDLKPDNIFLCEGPDGEPREPKVLDFGISKIAAGSDLRDLDLTQSGTVMGTPFYMSPEQVRGLRDVDARGDVYAFGVILYEMLTGACPFDADTYNELILKIVTEEATPLLSLNAEVDPILAAVIARAMSRDREQRYPSVAELAADLEPFGGGVTFRSSSAVPYSTPGSQPGLRGRDARSPGLAARRRSGRLPQLALLVLLGLGLVAVGAWWSLRDASDAGHVVSPARSAAPQAQAAPAAAAAQQAGAAEPPPSPARSETAIQAATEAPAAAARPRTEAAPAEPSRHGSRHAAREPRAEREREPKRAATGSSAKPAAAAHATLPEDWDEHLKEPAVAPPPSGPGGSPAGALKPSDL